ncbi:MAG: efflux RND transporter periplasmic adaptor subunit [Anaerolineae bacterium]|nr:efflux RND transporter periplasmic adaptor subunit [Gloeobacterales cyanobacterium ES-bin-313]
MSMILKRLLPLALSTTVLFGCSNPKITATPPPDSSAAATSPGTYTLTDQMEKRAGITVQPVARRSLASPALFSSSIEAPTNNSGIVTPPVAGIVTRVLADVGQTVQRGQILAYISSPELGDAQAANLTARAKVQEAQAQIQLTDGRVALAKADFEREKSLNQKGISALRDVQSAQGRYDVIRSELAATKTMYAAAQSNLAASNARLSAFRVAGGGTITSELALRSPVSGTITIRAIQPGQSVSPVSTAASGMHEHLFDISNLDEVWAMLEVPQSEVASLHLGAPVQFTSEVAPGKTFRGRVIRLGENFDAQARTVGVRAAIANSEGILKPGMLVLAQALAGNTKTVLAIPSASVQQVEGKTVVFVRVQPHTYRMQTISLGEHSSDYVEATSGLIAGQQVVTDGSFILKSEALKASLGGE